ncbi:hypothetical protein GBF38_021137 [Nibea albiflora]|uniref:Uncharacterized protein n=1 Tax=Nibea albiflora TaxID=240163 RepID=A0ACB7EWT7_NIBAL|nr:hypothetical protein GBF38_021137 [Nibea albiflora]
MSTFGVPLDFHELMPTTRNPHADLTEAGTTTTSGIMDMEDDALNKKSGFLEDHRDSAKHRVPSFSPADPVSTPRPQTQPIPVDTPTVPILAPHNDLHCTTLSSTGHHDNEESPIELEEEEEEMSVEESISTEDSLKEEDSTHIYESIQDLNLDLEALVGGRVSPEVLPEPAPAPPPLQSFWTTGKKKKMQMKKKKKRSSGPAVSSFYGHDGRGAESEEDADGGS